MKKIFLSFLVAAASLFAADNTIAVAKESMQKLGSTLKGELKAKFKQDPSGMKAIQYCSNRAQDITQSVNKKLDEGVNVRRTALKYRNNANEPTYQDIDVMLNFQKQMEFGKSAKNLTKVIKTDEKTYVYKALAVGKPCLKCHGDISKMDSKIVNEINKNFPYDRARNFALGDFRGAIVVEIEK